MRWSSRERTWRWVCIGERARVGERWRESSRRRESLRWRELEMEGELEMERARDRGSTRAREMRSREHEIKRDEIERDPKVCVNSECGYVNLELSILINTETY